MAFTNFEAQRHADGFGDGAMMSRQANKQQLEEQQKQRRQPRFHPAAATVAEVVAAEAVGHRSALAALSRATVWRARCGGSILRVAERWPAIRFNFGHTPFLHPE